MEKRKEVITEVFGNRLRVRVSGICIHEENILLVNHQGINEENEFWAPPGGGMDFGHSAEENLIREFEEETSLQVKVKDFLCVNEFIGEPLHAVELFFLVETIGGILQKGTEPELPEAIEMIKNVEYKPWSWIRLQPPEKLHNLLHITSSLEDLLKLQGYFLLRKNK